MKSSKEANPPGFFQEYFWPWSFALIKIAAIMLVIFFVLFQHHEPDYTGAGTVNLFPDSTKAKNYRLDSLIHVHSSWFGLFGEKTTDYEIKSVSWPDGGHSYFKKCVIVNGLGYCGDQDNKYYKIELEKAPT